MVKMFVLAVAAAGAALAASPELSAVKTVYMLPMSGGLDQYLAVALTNSGVFKVVTDPQKAEAVFSDHIGTSLEQSLHELFASTEKIEDGKPNDSFKPAMAPRARGKGSIFLVDRATRAVLWSVYAPPKDNQSDSLNRLAVRIAGQLQKDLKGK
ncbi:MAG TPA: hypothetical protein VKV74_10645 [Bryobacteraceae bacterium]|nr:hypothetical protein [Bryobacteraceae bacterium]